LLAAGEREKRVLLLDFSLPASPAHLALGLDINFTVPAAIRDIVRLDRTFLDSALARVSETGLYVLPLSNTAIGTDGLPALRDVFILLQMLRSLFDVVVIYWGALSRQAALGGLNGEGRYPFICCNQRFSSVRNAKGLHAEVVDGSTSPIEPVVVIHQLGPNVTPAPENIVRAIGAKRGFGLRSTWAALVQAQNSGRPLSLMGPSQYGNALRIHLATEGLLPPQQLVRERMPNLLEWLRKARVL
jgi:pilus assembly protein CpaE